jgi:hypothetical protein
MAVSLPAAQSPDDLAELLRLVEGSDSVELKLSVPDSDHQSTIRSLGLDPLESQIRQVFFFDTADLAANQAGVVVRARRIQGKATIRSSSYGRSSPRTSRRSSATPPLQRRGRCDARRLRVLGITQRERPGRATSRRS